MKPVISDFMMGLNKEAKELNKESVIPMPDVRPKDFSLPTAAPRFKNRSSQPTSAA